VFKASCESFTCEGIDAPDLIPGDELHFLGVQVDDHMPDNPRRTGSTGNRDNQVSALDVVVVWTHIMKDEGPAIGVGIGEYRVENVQFGIPVTRLREGPYLDPPCDVAGEFPPSRAAGS
jgi:hypothetical protein